MLPAMPTNYVSVPLNPSNSAIGGDYLTEEQAAALGRFLDRLHRRELRREQKARELRTPLHSAPQS